jgi:23S rRNA (uracil1939-C5)-methyltransferase
MSEHTTKPPKLKLLFSDDDVLPEGTVRMHHPMYGGDVESIDGAVRLPFVLRKEAVQVKVDGSLLRVIETAIERVKPRCVHFGTCGGCQYQMIADSEQLTVKRMILRGLLHAEGLDVSLGGSYDIAAHAGEPYGYRNRIRLRVERGGVQLRFGYNERGTTRFLPITMCPIAAGTLWAAAERLLAVALADQAAAAWLGAAKEVELFVDDTLQKMQMTLLCPPRTSLPEGSFAKAMAAISAAAPQIVGAAAIALDPRTGPTGRVLDAWGAAGLNYRVGDETYWISRGGFFQVNRFLLPKLVELVCAGRSGNLAWDLYAGVGLFSRVLARSFAHVTSVEANAGAARDLAVGMKRAGAGPQAGSGYRAVEATTLEFLRRAVLERERPELVVLDPPRAGAGREVCELLLQMAPAEIVYVSCDPATLARDWKVLADGGYVAMSADFVDLFPQTFHMETVVVFRRAA